MSEPFERLKVWQHARALVVQIYRITKTFPTDERFGLVQQMRRAAVGIAANVAEGNSRRSRREFQQFCHIARGSAAELGVYLMLSEDLGYLGEGGYRRLRQMLDEVGKLLQGLINHLDRASLSPASAPRNPRPLRAQKAHPSESGHRESSL